MIELFDVKVRDDGTVLLRCFVYDEDVEVPEFELHFKLGTSNVIYVSEGASSGYVRQAIFAVNYRYGQKIPIPDHFSYVWY